MVDFFVIGAVKSGTTSLHHYLEQHASIEMSRHKWVRFFHLDAGAPDFHALARRYGSTLLDESIVRYRMICNAKVPQNFESYLQQWDASKQNVIRGEISPTYMYDWKACERICSRFPRAKIIIILRDPIQRAISHFVMDRANRWVPELDFLTALRKEPVHVEEFWWGLRHYLRHGLYSRCLRRIASIFDPRNIKIMLYEDMLESPADFLADLIDFLGVERIRFDISQWHNSALTAKPILVAQTYEFLRTFYAQDVLVAQSMTNMDLGRWFNTKSR